MGKESYTNKSKMITLCPSTLVGILKCSKVWASNWYLGQLLVAVIKKSEQEVRGSNPVGFRMVTEQTLWFSGVWTSTPECR